jgi:prepilin-type N-terminal cleavage/methylation domain-containing protein
MGRTMAGPCHPRTHRGFTLIEMMVVMVLLGLVSALTLPSMQRWHDAVQARAQIALVVESLRGAMFAAASRRQDVLMDLSSFASAPAGTAAPADAASGASAAVLNNVAGVGPERVKVRLPEGWAVERVVDAVFMKNGLCRAGMALMRNPSGQQVVVQVSGPACSIDTLAEVPASLR